MSATADRARRDLLAAVGHGQVYRSQGGCDMRCVRAGQNQRVERALRALADDGLVELGPDGRYRLTGPGRALLAGGVP